MSEWVKVLAHKPDDLPEFDPWSYMVEEDLSYNFFHTHTHMHTICNMHPMHPLHNKSILKNIMNE